jgi:hypothetical protein
MQPVYAGCNIHGISSAYHRLPDYYQIAHDL